MPQSKDMTGLGGVSSVNSGRSIISTLVSGDDHHAAASCRLFFPAQSPGVNDILEIVRGCFGDCLEIVALLQVADLVAHDGSLPFCVYLGLQPI